MYSIIIKNGNVIDGSGKKPFMADVAIADDKIAAIGNLKNAKAEEVIDATGKYVVPGFVDSQNHSDVYWTIFDSPGLDSMVAQGITTIMVGNCGGSLAPLLSKEALVSIQKWHNLQGINVNWLSFKEFLNELSKRKFGTNIGSLVGYSTLRSGITGDNIRSLDESESKVLIKNLKQSLDAGAFGLSSGLSYAHEAIVAESELLTLAKILKDYNALLSVHLRSESAELTESVAEALELVYKTNVNLKISHFKAKNKANWHLLPHALNLIEDAYQKKGNVHFDLYPYDLMWQVMYIYLPRWAYEGGREAMLHHLKDPVQRKKILAYLTSKDIDYSQIIIASTSLPLSVMGRTLGEIARRHEISSEEVLLNIIENGGSEILVFEKNLNETQVEQLLGHSLSIIASDGSGFPASYRKGLVHPRCFGNMPRFLSLALEKNICSLEKAIQKITSIPAEKLGIAKRGRLAVDYFADVVVMDPGISSRADYVNPHQFPQGVDYVFVNGEISVIKGKLTNRLGGKVLRKNK